MPIALVALEAGFANLGVWVACHSHGVAETGTLIAKGANTAAGALQHILPAGAAAVGLDLTNASAAVHASVDYKRVFGLALLAAGALGV
jgi:hypothetical protein